jgi:cytochrome c oxidase cbb3-type subunit III
MKRTFSLAVMGTLALALAGCDWMPGKPLRSEEIVAPMAVTNFLTLYNRNCAGCHGIDGNIAGSFSLNDPTYLAFVPRETLRKIIVHGVPNTLMPAFSLEQGGPMTDEQIKILMDGIEGWKEPPGLVSLPPYSAPPGNAAAGKPLYETYVTALRARNGDAMFGDNFMANAAFLGLSSDQHLRTLLTIGRPELGIPNYLEAIPDRPLGDQDLDDMVAWLISQRKNEFGQPLSPTPPAPVALPAPAASSTSTQVTPDE